MSPASTRESETDKALKHRLALKCIISQHRNSAALGEESIMDKNLLLLPCPLAVTASSQGFFFG